MLGELCWYGLALGGAWAKEVASSWGACPNDVACGGAGDGCAGGRGGESMVIIVGLTTSALVWRMSGCSTLVCDAAAPPCVLVPEA
jgi:hypothetical protein